MAVTEEQITEVLRTIQDPELYKDLVTLNMIKRIRACEGNISVDVELRNPATRGAIRDHIERALRSLPGVDEVFVNTTIPASAPVAAAAPRPAGAPHAHAPGHSHNQPQQPPKAEMKNIKNIIAVGAGKGGVGKSTIAANLAVGLALAGRSVGLIDADIYGPSVPTLMGLGDLAPGVNVDMIVPFQIGGEGIATPLKVISIGSMVPKDRALIWRGPMAHGAVRQLLTQVEWGELDYLVVDLPPGTGDVSLTLAQTVSVTGAVIVATPQEVALADARRAVRMFQQLGIEILGVVENMSYFVCEHGKEYDIFGRGGAQLMAQQMGLAFLGEIPIDMAVRINSDAGKPLDNFAKAAASKHLAEMVRLTEAQIDIRNSTRPVAKKMDLRIS
jgi:ATP-binding protein involved in chromosome partitioning